MFIGRQQEMQILEGMYQSKNFEFLVLFGRRRVGKTSLLQEFSKTHNTVFFSAQEKNDTLNLADFSKAAQTHFDGHYYAKFSEWEAAFRYVGERNGDEKLVLIIDEFPFIASENPSIKSVLQHTIDHSWKEKNIFLVLCGSSVSFMENEVMGYKSPLYGRSTAQMEVEPFDYYESAQFFPEYSNLDKLLAYGILGGIPCYLQTFDDRRAISNNIATQILRTGSFLKDEPQLLLKMELREPAVYNSIFEAIAGGASRLNEISGKIHEESYKCSKYISTLRSIKLINKITPCGEKESSKKSLYKITDNYYSFWYHFVFPNKSYYEMLGEQDTSEEIMSGLSNYMGLIFENICYQYMIRLAKARKLPFIPHDIGRWWGNNSERRTQDDIDILALDKTGDSAIFCECKFRNELFDMNEYEDLMCASGIFKKPTNRFYYIFSKSGFTTAVQNKAQEDNVQLVNIDDLFSV